LLIGIAVVERVFGFKDGKYLRGTVEHYKVINDFLKLRRLKEEHIYSSFYNTTEFF
jgi:hypothetical protein